MSKKDVQRIELNEVDNWVNPDLSDKEVMFSPKRMGKRYFLTDLKEEYPELKKYPEFAELNKSQMMFVWMYASECSSLNSGKPYSEEDRLRIAFSVSFGIHGKHKEEIGLRISESEKLKYLHGEFPIAVKDAIARMRKFNPNYRLRARFMAEKMFTRLEEMIDNNEVDPGDMSKVLAAMDSVLIKVEGGYGFKEMSVSVETEDASESNAFPMDDLDNY